MRMNFVARPTMLAIELDHYASMKVSLQVALAMVGRLGEAHMETAAMSTWYFGVELVTFHGRDAIGKRIFMIQADFPMSLVINIDGRCYLRHKIGDTRHVEQIVRTLTAACPRREAALAMAA